MNPSDGPLAAAQWAKLGVRSANCVQHQTLKTTKLYAPLVPVSDPTPSQSVIMQRLKAALNIIAAIAAIKIFFFL